MGIRVLVADDHSLTLKAVREALRDSGGGIKVVAEATSGREALALAGRLRPDVALLDMHMPGAIDGLTCGERIKKRNPDARVVIFSAFTDESSVQATFRRGADAFLSKSVDPRDIGPMLRATVQRTVFHAPVASCASDDTVEGLTRREMAVLRAVAAGLPNKTISEHLWISEHTVKFHLTNIFRKTDTTNRTEASRWAHQHGLVSDPAPPAAAGNGAAA